MKRLKLTLLGEILYACAIDGPLGKPAVWLAGILPVQWLARIERGKK